MLDLLNFEKSTKYYARQKAALAYAEAIVWRADTGDEFWDFMHRDFSEPELVELGCMIGLTLGQQSWLRLLNIEHHEVMAGTSASMAPGFEDARRLRRQNHKPTIGRNRSRPTPNTLTPRPVGDGGVMSYESSTVYVGHIPNREKPADLPVCSQSISIL